MEHVTLQRPLAQVISQGLRAWWREVVAWLRPARAVAEWSSTLEAEQAAPLRRISRDDAPAYPQRWTPVRPALRADVTPGLRYPLAAPRPRLAADAAAHHSGWT